MQYNDGEAKKLKAYLAISQQSRGRASTEE